MVRAQAWFNENKVFHMKQNCLWRAEAFLNLINEQRSRERQQQTAKGKESIQVGIRG